ncbi:MAG TPA: alkaline phosphatase family protein [Planctomycetota bacterium]|nr:alkaline phosphatase family protein [Planctomycetota bacterium]
MRKTTTLPLVFAALCLAVGFSRAGEERRIENVLLITIDGLRWQEVFGGADATILLNEKRAEARTRFWKETPEERREALMPFFWQELAKKGQVFGAPEAESTARVTNGFYVSYPGYNEILTGRSDERIKSNEKTPNPNITVLEFLNSKPAFKDRVAVFSDWDVFPYIVNRERSGVYIHSHTEPFTHASSPEVLAALNAFTTKLPPYWSGSGFDAPVVLGALEYVKTQKPRVLYISLGETDDWAHDNKYYLYLDAAHRSDEFIRQIWTTVQAMPQYAGKTALVLTTDHGRGETTKDWTSHGKNIPAAERIWMAVMGPGIPMTGLRRKLQNTQGQIAATVAALLGEDFRAAYPEAAEPLPLNAP